MVKASKPATKWSPAARAARQRLVQQRTTPERQALSDEMLRKANALALRRELKARLKIERENIRLGEQLERLLRRDAVRLASVGARYLSRAKHILADDAKLDAAVAAARVTRSDRTVQPTAVDDNYAQPESAPAGAAVE